MYNKKVCLVFVGGGADRAAAEGGEVDVHEALQRYVERRVLLRPQDACITTESGAMSLADTQV